MSTKQNPPRFACIDDYIAAAAPEVQTVLREIREVARCAVPEASETIAYQMPALRMGRVFFYFAAFKNHIGIYPPLHGDADLLRELQPWSGPKGNLKFPLNQPMPYALIQRVVIALAKDYGKN